MATPDHVSWKRTGAVATVTIDRPAKRNALGLRTVEELRQAIDRCEADMQVRVVVLTGAGDRAFASGADLDEVPDAMNTPEHARAYDDKVGVLYDRLAETPLPVIARMQASAIGGGYLLALACDLRVCSASALIGIPVSRIGLMLSPEEHRLLVRQVGPSRAKLLTFTGRRLGAKEALGWGLVDLVVDDDALDENVDQLASDIASGAPIAVTAAKRMINDGPESDDVVQQCYRDIYTSDDLKEGLAALSQKRPPRFQGR